MDESEDSIDSFVTQEPFFSATKGELPSTHFTRSPQSSDQEKNCSAKRISNTVMHQDSGRAELCSPNIAVNSTELSKQVVSTVQGTAEDHSVPCQQSPLPITASSPVAALVPTTIESTPIQQLQEQTLLSETAPTSNSEEAPDVNDFTSIDNQVMSYGSGEDRSTNYSFTVSQDESYHVLTDEDSCDASYLQGVSDSADAFNQQYREKRDVEESSVVADSFSPEAFFSSIPQFKKLWKRPATILPKLSTTDSYSYRRYEHSDQYYSKESHGVIVSNSKPNSSIVMHSSSQGVPIAPKPDPNTKCYVLVVPAPMYYENFVPQESPQLKQVHEDDRSETVPSEGHAALIEIEATPEAVRLSNPMLMHPPEWTPQPQKPARTPLPLTMIRVSPSPNRGNRSSPVITVSTTSTPIQPLQGNKQQYVIVQGNNRHLKGISHHKDSFTTPTVEGNHQPIYLQGLPPQGFRRFWKTKEGSCIERTTKRSLAPLFSKVSPCDSQEATVPQTEKSPLTCIRSKLPCDREVPQTDNTSPDRKLLTNENSATSTTAPAAEESRSQTTPAGKVQECQNKCELQLTLKSKTNASDESSTTPTPRIKQGEDKEKKKLRDRRYDAELKKSFHQLRQMVPRLQKSSSRGQILQEAIKYIGILEKKVLDAGLLSTLQSLEAERSTQLETPGGTTQGVMENLVSPMSYDVPDICSNLIANTVEEPLKIIHQENGGEHSQEDPATALTSPVILIPPISLSTEELSCSFLNSEGSVVSIDSADANQEGVTVEEVPLSIPFQQIQFVAVDQSDETPVLTPRSPDESLSQEPLTRLIPVVEVPGYTASGEYVNVVHEGQISPHRDVFLSAMTTISQEGLSDLGVTLSPLLSPLGILLSPGGDPSQESTITVLVESKEGADVEEIISNPGIEENGHVSSGVISGICTDMTSIAASVEVTTDQRDKRTPLSTKKTRRKSQTAHAQIVPSVSPLQASEDGSIRGTPRCRNRRVLQDHSNFEDAKSPVGSVGRPGRQRKLKDHSPKQPYQDDADENFAFAASQSRTPPGRVSGVLLTGKRKTPSPRGRVGTKRGRRI
ncbi:uncharacterized protein LOC144644550 isoform X2 [Oculina patagonica]